MGLLNKAFFKLGYYSASHPGTSCFFAMMLTLICALGFINFKLTSDPQSLWVPKDSRANIEQTYFTEQFGAFFRINTVWLTPLDEAHQEDDIFDTPYLVMLHYLQQAIEGGIVEYNGGQFQLDNFCYKPISGQGCLVTSPMEYWKSDLDTLMNDTDVKLTAQCIPPPNSQERVCFDKIGVPVMQFAIFGKLKCDAASDMPCSACKIKASGFQATFLLNNNGYSFDTAQQWEKNVFIKNIKSFNTLVGYNTELEPGMDYNYTLIEQLQNVTKQFGKNMTIRLKADYLAERSIPDNIEEEGTQNAYIVIISYIMMFIYVSVSIGFFPSFVYNRFLLGLAGILVVICSLLIAIGLTFYAGVPLTMISAEVVPFLILAIGVDNMFLISRAERAIPADVTDMELRIAYAMKEIGPSIFTAAFCEALAFFIGMLTDVPALWSFCLVAGLSVIADFVLQMTFFLACLTLDGKRIQQNRVDVLFCIKAKERKKPRKEWIRTLFGKYYVPLLFYPLTQIFVFGIAACLFILGVSSCIKVQLGLNQNVSLVQNSDTYDYFNVLFDYGAAGPPAYLVFKNINYTYPGNLDKMSEIQVQLASLSDTVIAPVYSWVTQFNNFINPQGNWKDACGTASAAILDFDSQIKQFVKIEVNSNCCQHFGICGEQFVNDIIFDDNGKVSATRFRFQHKPLKYQQDYINGLLETRRATDLFAQSLVTLDNTDVDIALNIEGQKEMSLTQKIKSALDFTPQKLIETEVTAPSAFTYSLFYVYYDQYTYIRGILSQNALLGIAAIIFALQLLSGLSIALIIGICVFLVMFELLGCMWMLNEVFGSYPIEMNAVLVVNLVTSLGFGVEFCNHVGMNFMRQAGDRETRARNALTEMGSSVLVGIASTKFIGVIVLAFAPSTLFKLYYFRMYLFIIFLGLFNGLMFLPLVLRWIGPAPDKGELREHAINEKEFEMIKHRNEKKKAQESPQ